MARQSLLLAVSLFMGLASFGTGCAHQLPESASAQLDIAPPMEGESEAEAEGEEGEGEEGESEGDSFVASAQPAGPEVISFDELDGDAFDAVVAPPKREQIPSFQLFGEGDSESTPGPRLTLPPDME